MVTLLDRELSPRSQTGHLFGGASALEEILPRENLYAHLFDLCHLTTLPTKWIDIFTALPAKGGHCLPSAAVDYVSNRLPRGQAR